MFFIRRALSTTLNTQCPHAQGHGPECLSTPATAGREFPDVAFALPDVDLDMRKVDISTLLSRNQALSAISELPFFF